LILGVLAISGNLTPPELRFSTEYGKTIGNTRRFKSVTS
jgi:hypothetical protein